MDGMLKVAENTYRNYVGNSDSAHMLLMIAALVLILIFAKEVKYKIVFSGYLLLFAIVYWCPFTAWIIGGKMIGKSVYWRMFWALPAALITAYGLVCFIEKFPKRWIKVLLLLLCVAGIGATGTQVFSKENYSPYVNQYKLPIGIPEACELVLTDAKDQGIEKIKAVPGNQVLCYIRQYDASIYMPYGRNVLRDEAVTEAEKEIFTLVGGATPNYQRLHELMEAEVCNYLILSDLSEEIKSGYLASGFELVGDAANHTVMRLA